jgi:RNA polymerase sigma-70 factor (ECF subfamily)
MILRSISWHHPGKTPVRSAVAPTKQGMDGTDDVWTRAVIEQNHRWLFALFLAATGDRAVSDDLVQQTFLEALKSRGRFDPQRSFGAWLRGIANHMLLAHWRARRIHALDPAALAAICDAAEAMCQEDPSGEEERRAALPECLKTLSERARILLDLRYRDGMDSLTIGGRLGMSRTAVDMAVSRARQAMRFCIERRLGVAT